MEKEKSRKETFEEMRARIKAPKTKKKRKKRLKNKGSKTYSVPKKLKPKTYSNTTLEQFENGFNYNNKQFKKKFVKNNRNKTILKPISSKGEEIIEVFFKQYNILYQREYIFSECFNPKTGAFLRFDFYLKNINVCVEFDGIQHFKPSIELFGKDADNQLKEQKYRDNIKNKFCKEKGIILIRFNYKQYRTLEQRLKNYFVKYC